MASATFFLRRSHFYCRNLFTTATKQSRLFVPTAISSVRQLSSLPVMNNVQTSSSDVKPVTQKMDDQLVRDLQSQLQLMRGEIESLRKDKEESSLSKENDKGKEKSFQKEEVVAVKEIESAMSKAEFLGEMLPYGFKVVCDKPGVAKVTLKKLHKKEIINIELSGPKADVDDPDFELKLIVKVSLSEFFKSTVVEFHCTSYTKMATETAEETMLLIDKINYHPSGGQLICFSNFGQLSKSLRNEFYKYLVMRGVVKDTAYIFCKYMKNKRERDLGKALCALTSNSGTL